VFLCTKVVARKKKQTTKESYKPLSILKTTIKKTILKLKTKAKIVATKKYRTHTKRENTCPPLS
jgi:hypothetical protein